MQGKPQKLMLFDTPIKGKYLIRLKLKTGGFGSVYLARDCKNNKLQYAIKLVSQQNSKYSDIEIKMYKLIQSNQYTNGFPKIIDYGEFMKHRFITMQLLGSDLDDLMKKSEKQRLSIKTCLMIGLQVVDRLEALHKIGFVHRDVKPDNFTIGTKEKIKIIYLIDFGLAQKIGVQSPDQKGKAIGTLAFMSCNSHQGKVQGPIDDLQALIYSLLYLAEGTLPWMKINITTKADFHKILMKKKSISKKDFKNQNIPSDLFDILDLVKNKSKVDYLKIKYMLISSLKKIGEENDFAFDWCKIKSKKKLSPAKKFEGETERKNKQIQQMKQDNQKIVQKEIYQVFKFMNKNPQNQQNAEEKQQTKKRQSPKKKEKQLIKNLKPKINEKPRIRPVTAKKMKPKEQPYSHLLGMETPYTGPKIVINMTAKHKI